MSVGIYRLWSATAVLAGPGHAASFDDVIALPQSHEFWLERRGGVYRQGDPQSHFTADHDYTHLTYDIGNNKVLANLDHHGTLKALTIYRDSYRAACKPDGWSGVWTAKDSSSFGPYSFALTLDGQRQDLDKVDWDLRTGLLDNIFPFAELRAPDGRLTARLLVFAPLSADGRERLRGVVYGLHLTNTSGHELSGTVHLPKLFTGDRPHLSWAQFDPYEFELGLGDAPAVARDVPFRLAPGATVWVPAILYQPGEPTISEVNARGTLAWFNDAWRYYRGLLGRVETPGEPWLGEHYERELMQCLGSLAMSGSGKLAGSNWGSYPATRQIWAKDCYYSCLPLVALDPALAEPIVLWFHEFGVRHPGTIVEGGLSHSISLSVADILLASLHWRQTGERGLFERHPELREDWGRKLDALVATRRDSDVWLLPTHFISDGALDCDYHTGSNVCIQAALAGYARLLTEVWHEPAAARRYADMADKVGAALAAKTVIDGPFGRQYIEGTYADGRPPLMISDGEESDTTLMPYYGLTTYDDPTYVHTMTFAVSPHNRIYDPAVHAITWAGEPIGPLEKRVPSTAPGYNKGLCGPDDLAWMTEVRRVTDADGSVWWWSYGGSRGKNFGYGRVVRGVPGKAGWFAGVYAAVFASRWLGVSWDAPRREFGFAPRLDDLRWQGGRFALTWQAHSGTFSNHDTAPLKLVLTLPAGELTRDGRAALTVAGSYLGRAVVRATVEVAAGATVHIEIH
jgi:hypothetical protein